MAAGPLVVSSASENKLMPLAFKFRWMARTLLGLKVNTFLSNVPLSFSQASQVSAIQATNAAIFSSARHGPLSERFKAETTRFNSSSDRAKTAAAFE